MPWTNAIDGGQRMKRIDAHGEAAGFRKRAVAPIAPRPLGPDGCASFQVALRRGEALQIETTIAPAFFTLTDVSGKRSFSPSWSEDDREAGSFTAPFDGWYDLDIRLPPPDPASKPPAGWRGPGPVGGKPATETSVPKLGWSVTSSATL